jgi:hypothetical protein
MANLKLPIISGDDDGWDGIDIMQPSLSVSNGRRLVVVKDLRYDGNTCVMYYDEGGVRRELAPNRQIYDEYLETAPTPETFISKRIIEYRDRYFIRLYLSSAKDYNTFTFEDMHLSYYDAPFNFGDTPTVLGCLEIKAISQLGVSPIVQAGQALAQGNTVSYRFASRPAALNNVIISGTVYKDL